MGDRTTEPEALLLVPRHDLVLALLRIVSEAIEGWTTDALAKRGFVNARSGSVTVIQRFGRSAS